MFTRKDIRQIIEECREIGDVGLNNGVYASIPHLEIDIVEPPGDFLGVNGNPAIFINGDTYKLLGSLHSNWVENKTIALKVGFLEHSPINVIGAIIHETGHAFNVAANINNTEANAYIFEIEVMLKLFKTNSPLLFGCTAADVQSYFASRLPYYNKVVNRNTYVASLVEHLKTQFELGPKDLVPTRVQPVTPTVFLRERFTLFAHSQWKKEHSIIMAAMRGDVEVKIEDGVRY